jgi:hypothetical protein
MYLEPFNFEKIESEESTNEILKYELVEFKYPGIWCTLHSNGRNCTLESAEGVIFSDKMNFRCDLVGHYWQFKNKNIFTYFDIVTIEDENISHMGYRDRRRSINSYYKHVPKWVLGSRLSKIEKWNFIWRYKVLSSHKGIDFPGLIFKNNDSQFGTDMAVLNKSI